ncbi:MAG: hypothetical protein M3154_08755 [Candidatus Eremiobacteraeota bacterium]|nr:hypothetical protein [Candidatus Eremiobacteraeota bacterium]
MSESAIVGARWVHVDGDDVAAGAVYHNAESDLPLSRRPKEYLEFSADGTVRKLATGADDRAHEIDRATWSEDAGHVAFRFGKDGAPGATEYHIMERAPDRLVIRRR